MGTGKRSETEKRKGTMTKHIGKNLNDTSEAAESRADLGDLSSRMIIFLDVDGVLNDIGTHEMIGSYVAVDPKKVAVLKKLCEILSDPVIVLSSSWKEDWYRDDKKSQDIFADTLDRALAEQGLYISDKTHDRGYNRGKGIRTWLKEHGPVRGIVILDDEPYDYDEEGLLDYWVQTYWYTPDGGLKESNLLYIQENIARLCDIPPLNG